MRKFAILLPLLLFMGACVSLGQTAATGEPTLAPLYQTVPIFENTLPQCGFDVIEPITVEESLHSPRVVEELTARAMFLGGEALILLPSFSPMAEAPYRRTGPCSLAVIKFRKWTCKH